MIVSVSETTDTATCFALRRAVFIEEQGVSEADELDGTDAGAVHLLALEGDLPVGCARFLIKGDTAKIGRVCVLKDRRGQGLGAQIIRASLAAARTRPGVIRAVLGAQVHALGFYETLGFTAFGPVYDDAGIDHRDMEITL